MNDPAERTGFTVAITPSQDEIGVDIVDPIERRRCRIRTPDPVRPTTVPASSFPIPADSAVTFETDTLSVSSTGQVYVRDSAGELIAEYAKDGVRSFPHRDYVVEFPGLIHMGLAFESSFILGKSDGNPEIGFPGDTRVVIGCRSLHSRPAGEIVTTAEPHDIAAAISTFGSALKSTGPERSFPTYRGHPPAIVMGEEADIPTPLMPPIQDVSIEVPPRLDRLFPVSTLAYYLGVPVLIGPRPRITGEGIEYELDCSDVPFDRCVSRLLRQMFLLDCAVRTEGRWDVDTRIREVLNTRLDMPLKYLFDASFVDRLQAYLEVPYEKVSDLIPEWRVVAHLDSVPERSTTLPHLANDLAVVRNAGERSAADGGIVTISQLGDAKTETITTGDVSIDGERCMERVWFGDGVPLGATKGEPRAYEHRIERSPRDGPIQIAVVCNESDMDAEGTVVDKVYNSRDELPFEVSLYQQLTVDELSHLLTEDFHFFHYVGHIDDDGFRCQDGQLNPTSLDTVGPEAFFLNACESYKHGLALIHRGAIGGIVTRNEVVNYGAVRIGRVVARLLNLGYPLRAALSIARSESVMGNQYTLVGDGTLSVVQSPSGLSQLYVVRDDDDTYQLRIRGFGAQPGMGCMWIPFIPGNERHYLASAETDNFSLTPAQLHQFLSLETVPILLGEQLTWSDEWSPKNE